MSLQNKQSYLNNSTDPGRDRQLATGVADGFTLMELMVSISVILVLLSLVIASVAKAQRAGKGAVCLSQQRQLVIAWLNYSSTHQELAPNSDQPTAGTTHSNLSWVGGWLRLDNELGDRSDATNTELLVGTRFAEFGSLGPFAVDPRIYKCSMDKSMATIDGSRFERVRSVSMNAYMNGTGIWNNDGWLTYRNDDAIDAPSDRWVFIEERPDSINDGYFATSMGKAAFLDAPSTLHDGGCYVAFADGHVSYKKWQGAIASVPYVPDKHRDNAETTVPAGDPDVKWLAEHTTGSKSSF